MGDPFDSTIRSCGTLGPHYDGLARIGICPDQDGKGEHAEKFPVGEWGLRIRDKCRDPRSSADLDLINQTFYYEVPARSKQTEQKGEKKGGEKASNKGKKEDVKRDVPDIEKVPMPMCKGEATTRYVVGEKVYGVPFSNTPLFAYRQDLSWGATCNAATTTTMLRTQVLPMAFLPHEAALLIDLGPISAAEVCREENIPGYYRLPNDTATIQNIIKILKGYSFSGGYTFTDPRITDARRGQIIAALEEHPGVVTDMRQQEQLRFAKASDGNSRRALEISEKSLARVLGMIIVSMVGVFASGGIGLAMYLLFRGMREDNKKTQELMGQGKEVDLLKDPIGSFKRLVFGDAILVNTDLRTHEIRDVVGILRGKGSVILCGPAGGGKTAILYGMQQMFESGQFDDVMPDTTIVILDKNRLTEGTEKRSSFETRLYAVVKESIKAAESGGAIIIGVDDLRNFLGAGTADGVAGFSAELLQHMSDGNVQLVATMTEEEYEILRRDPRYKAFFDRFQRPVYVDPLTSEENLVSVLRTKVPMVARVDRVFPEMTITEEALAEVVNQAATYLPDHMSPRKEVELLKAIIGAKRVKNGEDPSKASMLTVEDVRQYCTERFALGKRGNGSPPSSNKQVCQAPTLQDVLRMDVEPVVEPTVLATDEMADEFLRSLRELASVDPNVSDVGSVKALFDNLSEPERHSSAKQLLDTWDGLSVGERLKETVEGLGDPHPSFIKMGERVGGRVIRFWWVKSKMMERLMEGGDMQRGVGTTGRLEEKDGREEGRESKEGKGAEGRVSFDVIKGGK